MNAADPASILRAFDAALNAHDLEGALALFAGDATVRYEPPPPLPSRAVYRGEAEIRAWLNGLMARAVAVRAERYDVEGERAISRGRQVYAAGHEALGGNPIGLDSEAIVRQGRIQALTFTFSPDSLQRMRAASGEQQPVPPPPPPRS